MVSSPKELYVLLEEAVGEEIVPIEVQVEIVKNLVCLNGLGIVVKTPLNNLYMKLKRKYGLKGKVFMFYDEKIPVLEQYKDYVFYLITEVELGGEELSIKKQIGIFYTEFLFRSSRRLKRRFKPWKIYKGEIVVGRRREHIEWMIPVPTYYRLSHLYLCSPGDIERKIEKKNKTIYYYPIRNIVEAYLYGTRRGRRITAEIRTTAQPLFKYEPQETSH